MEKEKKWTELGRYWVPEPAQLRVRSLKTHGIEARVQSPGQSGTKAYVVEVPTKQVEEARRLLAELYPPKEKEFRDHKKADLEMKQKGQRNLVMGGVILLLGLVLTFGSFVSTDGWSGVLCYGAILTGLFTMLMGWLQMR
jgi:hypothetical protein